jgi:hypothetical protein
MDLNDIPKEAYGIIGTALGAFIGGGIGIFTMWMTLRNQRKLEIAKLRAARQDALHKEFSGRFQSLATDLAAAAHCMCWFTWSAAHDAMNDKMVADYDIEIHEILPKLIGDHISVTAVDKELGLISHKFVDYAHEVDEQIGIACLAYAKNKEEGMEKLKTLNKAARAFDEEVYERLAEFAAKRYSEFLNEPIIRSWFSRFRKQQVAG